jgi:hypothetical protein
VLLLPPSPDRSSTGIVAIHATLIPETSDVLLWTRLHPDGRGGYEPGIAPPGRVPYVGVLYSTTTGVSTTVSSLYLGNTCANKQGPALPNFPSAATLGWGMPGGACHQLPPTLDPSCKLNQPHLLCVLWLCDIGGVA